MKVGILTWYQAKNHGAVLQTYASCCVLRELGVEPVVLNYSWNLDGANKNSILNVLKKISLSKLIWKYKERKFFREKENIFGEAVKELLPLGDYYYNENNLDAIYIGSDMVFDITQGYNPYMYGYGVSANYIFSYAACFGYTTIEKLESHPHKDVIVESLKSLKSIGYRDKNTRDICAYCGVESSLVENVDPALMYNFKREIVEWDTGKWSKRNYILIYSYASNMNAQEEVFAIREIAFEENLEVISCGYFHDWCDESICADPREFVEMIKHARYVITDTFHGTIFALNLHKKFASIIRGNGFKLRYLLESCGFEKSIVHNLKNLKMVLHTDKDYDSFEKWRNIESDKSRLFIENNLAKAAMEKKMRPFYNN